MSGGTAGQVMSLLSFISQVKLASCLIYAWALKEYISSSGCWSNGYVLFEFSWCYLPRNLRKKKCSFSSFFILYLREKW